MNLGKAERRSKLLSVNRDQMPVEMRLAMAERAIAWLEGRLIDANLMCHQQRAAMVRFVTIDFLDYQTIWKAQQELLLDMTSVPPTEDWAMHKRSIDANEKQYQDYLKSLPKRPKLDWHKDPAVPY